MQTKSSIITAKSNSRLRQKILRDIDYQSFALGESLFVSRCRHSRWQFVCNEYLAPLASTLSIHFCAVQGSASDIHLARASVHLNGFAITSITGVNVCLFRAFCVIICWVQIVQRAGYEVVDCGYETSKHGYESSGYETTGYPAS